MSGYFPDSDITVEDFFTDFVPARFVADGAAELLPSGVLPPVCVEVEGAPWTLRVADGELEVLEGVDGEPLATVRLSEDDWRAAVTGTLGGGYEPTEADLDRMRRRARVSREMIDKVRALRCRIVLEVLHFADRTWRAEVIVGPEGEVAKSLTARIGAMDCEAVVRGEKDPLALYNSGVVEIVGAEALALDLIRIAVPDFQSKRKSRGLFGRR